MRTQILGSALLAVFIPFCAYPTHAEPASGVREVRVSYEDVAIGTPSGARVLDSRLRKAARSVCDEAGPGIGPRLAARTCEQNARSRAYQDIAARGGPNDMATMTYGAPIQGQPSR
jgi:UrcA family protein